MSGSSLNEYDTTLAQYEMHYRETIAEAVRYKFMPLCDCEDHDPLGISKLVKEIIQVIKNENKD